MTLLLNLNKMGYRLKTTNNKITKNHVQSILYYRTLQTDCEVGKYL